jgi:amino acid permease
MRSFSPTAKAALTLLGTMMGAGLFALPAAFAHVGWVAGSIGFFGVAGLVLLTHLIYATVFLQESTKHRLPGLVKRELGPRTYALASVSHPLHLMGAHVAYLMLGAEFLRELLQMSGMPISFVLALGCFFGVNAWLIRYGLRSVAKIESVATGALGVGVIASILILFGTRTMQPIPSVSVWSFWQPFGIFLFALSGFPVIGEVVQIAQRPKSVYRAVLLGTGGAVVLSFFFALAFSGGLGRGTGDLASLLGALPASFAWIFPIVGLLAIVTSYITTATDLIEGFRDDFRWSMNEAFVAAVLPPVLLAVLLDQRLLLITGIVGTVFCGLNGVLIALVAHRVFQRQAKWRVWRPLALLTAFVYTMAMLIRLSAWLV